METQAASSTAHIQAGTSEDVEVLRERIADLEVRNARLLDEVGVLRGRAEIDIPHWRSELCKCSEVLEQHISPFRGAPLGERLAEVLDWQHQISEGLRSLGGAALREERDTLKDSFAQHYKEFEAKRKEFEDERVAMLDFKEKMSKKNDMLKDMVSQAEGKSQEWEIRFQQMETYWQEQVQIAYQAGVGEGQRLSQQGVEGQAAPAEGYADQAAPVVADSQAEAAKTGNVEETAPVVTEPETKTG
eukprot:TRINITY_DN41424_c0_g1_i1.p1 TRINITY_DN41424_c0_g1~~TRINITY_DN41424_c0_g1_i1.p1  ORF type:complete len:245 (-),score=56.91 TRINITY_DN41424_c0_g1_i1:114-848(-)